MPWHQDEDQIFDDRTIRQANFGLDQSKYYVTKDRYEHEYWIVYLPTIPLIPIPGERVVNRFPTHSQCIGFINWREKLIGMA